MNRSIIAMFGITSVMLCGAIGELYLIGEITDSGASIVSGDTLVPAAVVIAAIGAAMVITWKMATERKEIRDKIEQIGQLKIQVRHNEKEIDKIRHQFDRMADYLAMIPEIKDMLASKSDSTLGSESPFKKDSV